MAFQNSHPKELIIKKSVVATEELIPAGIQVANWTIETSLPINVTITYIDGTTNLIPLTQTNEKYIGINLAQGIKSIVMNGNSDLVKFTAIIGLPFNNYGGSITGFDDPTGGTIIVIPAGGIEYKGDLADDQVDVLDDPALGTDGDFYSVSVEGTYGITNGTPSSIALKVGDFPALFDGIYRVDGRNARITNNELNIVANAGAISVNSINIATNVTDIGTNATNILANTALIDDKFIIVPSGQTPADNPDVLYFME